MQVPNIVLPPVFKSLGQRLPNKPPQYLLVLTLNKLLRKGILPADMSLLAGRFFEIIIEDAGLRIQFSANEERFIIASTQNEPDLRFTAKTVDFVKMMLRKEDPDTLFFNRKLEIEGDTELGLIVKNLLDSIDWSTVPLMRFIVGD